MGSIKSRKLKKQKINLLTDSEKLDFQAFLSSLFFHVIILLVMSFIVLSREKAKPKRIELSWQTEQSSVLQEEIPIELPTEDPFPAEVMPLSETEIENQTEITELTIETPDISTVSVSEELDINDISETMVETISSTSDSAQSQPVESSISRESNDIVRELAKSIGGSLAPNNGLSSGNSEINNIGQRLRAAGAKTGDVQISIAWNTIDDIDVHVEFSPGNGLSDHINWTNRFGRLTGGMLDVDMNAHQPFLQPMPVENIFWPPQSSPSGNFSVYIHFYRSWTGNRRVPVLIVVKSMGKISEYKEVAILGMGPQHIISFSTIQKSLKF